METVSRPPMTRNLFHVVHVCAVAGSTTVLVGQLLRPPPTSRTALYWSLQLQVAPVSLEVPPPTPLETPVVCGTSCAAFSACLRRRLDPTTPEHAGPVLCTCGPEPPRYLHHPPTSPVLDSPVQPSYRSCIPGSFCAWWCCAGVRK
uniref:Uncharacterized protein n=1 Tax=Lygus hesperus TaxID=30085 RepID=A0A146LQF0_LYGHE